MISAPVSVFERIKMIPFTAVDDHSRVILRSSENDYINANFIKVTIVFRNNALSGMRINLGCSEVIHSIKNTPKYSRN